MLYRRWRRLVDEYANEPVLVGEVVFSDPVRMTPYLRRDELHMAFNFTLLFQNWDAEGIRDAIDTSIAALGDVGATPTWVLENHDVTRLPTRYGGGEEGLRRARAAALLLLALPGPVYLYQGQELGLEEVDLPDEVRQDPIFHRMKGERDRTRRLPRAAALGRRLARLRLQRPARRGCRSPTRGRRRPSSGSAPTTARRSRSTARRSPYTISCATTSSGARARPAHSSSARR